MSMKVYLQVFCDFSCIIQVFYGVACARNGFQLTSEFDFWLIHVFARNIAWNLMFPLPRFCWQIYLLIHVSLVNPMWGQIQVGCRQICLLFYANLASPFACFTGCVEAPAIILCTELSEKNFKELILQFFSATHDGKPYTGRYIAFSWHGPWKYLGVVS